MTAVLRVADLYKTYGTTKAVDGVSFAVEAGRTTALLGGNGAGKTTTLSILLGLLTPTSGSIDIFGHKMPKDRKHVQGQLNFSSPYVDLPQKLTVLENLNVYARLYGVQRDKDWQAHLFQMLQITGYLKMYYGQLSAGQKTRVSLAKSLINRPRLLLLDEPTASLDPDTADWVRTVLMAYQTETNASILLASHNMPEVERMAHDVVMMRMGKIVDQGSPQNLIARYGRATMEEVFLDVARNRSVHDEVRHAG